MSGLSHTPGKRAWGYTHRGFESRPFRQYPPGNPHGCWVFWLSLNLNPHSNTHGDFKVLAIVRCMAMPECQQGGVGYRLLHLNRCTRLPSEQALFRQQATYLVHRLVRHTQPYRQTMSSCSSRQAMTCVALENTASISTDTSGSVGKSG